jgi:CheY-like chemotaxis protein
MDGKQMIRALRHRFPATKIIAISGDAEALAQTRALRVQGTLLKPVALLDLLTTVEKLVAPCEA